MMIDQWDIMVTTRCQARCAFCVQEATFRSAFASESAFLGSVRRFARDFNALGGHKIIITGGEPLLVQERVLAVLNILREEGPFDLVALYTNGEYLSVSGPSNAGAGIASRLANSGLTAVNLSVHHFDDEQNRRILGRPARPPTTEIVQALGLAQLPCRFNLVLQKGGIDSVELFDRYVTWAFAMGAEDVYARGLFEFTLALPISRGRYNSLPYCRSHSIDLGMFLEDLIRRPDYSLLDQTTAPFRHKQEYNFLHMPTSKRVYVSELSVGSEDRKGLPYLVLMPDGLLYRGWLGECDRIHWLRRETIASQQPCL